MDEIAIRAERIEKEYRIYHTASEKYKDFFLPRRYGEPFYALDGVDFQVKKGESLGLIGLNGSGKSTLANILAGASNCTGGNLETVGKVSMISINAGVDPYLTGLENIMQKGLLLGLSHNEIRDLTPQIIDFSDLGDFIGQQVKTYSSGMRARLGFAISINIDPDILIIDEALSVGDPTFTDKCLDKMRSFRKNGKTIVFVSHSIPQVRDFCDSALWLEGGRIRDHGDCLPVTQKYVKFVREFKEMPENEKKRYYQTIRGRQMRRG